MFQYACCRCVWPFIARKGNTKFPDVEDIHNEEGDHLLDNVAESDDEQADPLSPDQIRRFLDGERGEAVEMGSEKGLSERGPGRAEELLLKGQSRSAASGRLVDDDHDDLFEDDLEDEPENVVVGANLQSLRSINSRHSPELLSRLPRREGSLHDWIDTADEVSPPAPVPLGRPGGHRDRQGSVEIPSRQERKPSASQQFSMEALGALPSLGTGWTGFVDRSFHTGCEPVELFATTGNGAHSGTRSDWAEALDSVCLGVDTSETAMPSGGLHEMSTVQHSSKQIADEFDLDDFGLDDLDPMRGSSHTMPVHSVDGVTGTGSLNDLNTISGCRPISIATPASSFTAVPNTGSVQTFRMDDDDDEL